MLHSPINTDNGDMSMSEYPVTASLDLQNQLIHVRIVSSLVGSEELFLKNDRRYVLRNV